MTRYTTVHQHTRRIGPKTGVRKPFRRVDESKPFFIEEEPGPKIRWQCRIGWHDYKLIRFVHLRQDLLKEIECRHCKKRVIREVL